MGLAAAVEVALALVAAVPATLGFAADAVDFLVAVVVGRTAAFLETGLAFCVYGWMLVLVDEW